MREFVPGFVELGTSGTFPGTSALTSSEMIGRGGHPSLLAFMVIALCEASPNCRAISDIERRPESHSARTWSHSSLVRRFGDGFSIG